VTLGYTDEIKLLLVNEASIYSYDQKGANPAHYAAQHSLPALKLLLEKSKQVRILSMYRRVAIISGLS
jgi:hypothetical protein